jgi:hypothetical protein
LKIEIDFSDFAKLEKELLKTQDKGKALLSEATNTAAEFIQRKIITAYPINNKNDIHIRDTVKIKKTKISKKFTYQKSLISIGSKKAPYSMALEWGKKTKNGRSKAGHYVEDVKNQHGQKAAQIMMNILAKRLGLK